MNHRKKTILLTLICFFYILLAVFFIGSDLPVVRHLDALNYICLVILVYHFVKNIYTIFKG